MKEIKINGVISSEEGEITEEIVQEEFLKWIEGKGYFFGGGIYDVTDRNAMDEMREAKTEFDFHFDDFVNQVEEILDEEEEGEDEKRNRELLISNSPSATEDLMGKEYD